MHNFSRYSEFRTKVKQEYIYGEIDLDSSGTRGYWLDQGMYRWYRLCRAISQSYHGRKFRLLDIGAYPFTALKVAKVLFPEADLLGTGLWDASVEQILKNDSLLKNGEFGLSNFDPWITVPEQMLGIGKNVPFADASVDFVIFTEVVEHLYNPAHVLKEISRVLKRGGRLYLTTNNVAYWFYALRLLKGETNLDRALDQITVDFEREYPHDWRGHVRFYSIGQLEEMLKTAGINRIILSTTYDTTDILPGEDSVFKRVKTHVKALTNGLPFMNKLRGHIEIIAEKE